MANAVFQVNKETQSPSAEGFRALRTNLVFAAEDRDCRMILLVSPQKDPESPRFAANLGATMACENRKVLLVDGDLRTGALTGLLIPEAQKAGLSDWMEGRKSLEDVLVSGEDGQPSVLPCGKLCADPGELFSGEKASELLRSLRDRFDYVIVYAPDVETYTDAVVLGRITDGAVVLLSAEKTKMGAAEKCKAKLEAVKAPILGAVLSSVK